MLDWRHLELITVIEVEMPHHGPAGNAESLMYTIEPDAFANLAPPDEESAVNADADLYTPPLRVTCDGPYFGDVVTFGVQLDIGLTTSCPTRLWRITQI